MSAPYRNELEAAIARAEAAERDLGSIRASGGTEREVALRDALRGLCNACYCQSSRDEREIARCVLEGRDPPTNEEKEAERQRNARRRPSLGVAATLIALFVAAVPVSAFILSFRRPTPTEVGEEAQSEANAMGATGTIACSRRTAARYVCAIPGSESKLVCEANFVPFGGQTSCRWVIVP